LGKFGLGEDELCASDKLTEYLLDKDGTQPILDGLLQKNLFPGAEKGLAFTVPLCDLSDIQALHNKIVHPLLEAANKLG